MEVKICAISDIHGSLIEIPECDILCICGDILPLDIQRNNDESVAWLAGPFQNWLLDAPCKYVVMIWGNHDWYGEKCCRGGLEGWEQCERLFKRDLGPDPKIHILQDEEIEVLGIKFYGTSWCPSLRNWAFYGDSETLKARFSDIPTDTDVLLTHCPPKFGSQGVVLETNWNYRNDFGCQELQDVIVEKFKHKTCTTYILSGHIHSGLHNWEVNEGLTYRNVSLLNEDYELSYQPFIFEIPC
jgi:hypothetical protein